MIEQFIDNFVRKRDVFSALKRANVTRILINITERSFLMLEAVQESSLCVHTREAFHNHLACFKLQIF